MEIDHLLEFSEDNQIQAINLLPHLRQIEYNYELYFPIDLHFSVKGNEEVGKILAKELETRGLI